MSNLLPCLLHLARKGSYAQHDASDDTFAVFCARNDFASPLARFAGDLVQQGMADGLLRRDPRSTKVLLSEEGRRAVTKAVRAAKSPTAPGRVASPPSRDFDAQAPKARARQSLRIEGPLAWLRRRKDRDGNPLITQSQYEAGTRLAADYARARMLPRVTANWSASAPASRSSRSGPAVIDISDAAIAARDRLYRAMDAVGPEISPLLLDICCHEIGLEQAEKARGWPQRSGKVVLDMGLTALARHYGIIVSDTRHGRPAPIRAWREAEYAPNLDQWL